MIGRTAKLSKVSCLANNFLLQGVEHFFKEWVCWLLPGEEERLILSCNYPLIVICLLEISDDQSYNQIFVKWFDSSRTSAKSKGSYTQRHGYNENLTILDREPILSRSRSRIQWAGFSHEGHGPQCKKCMGTLDPRCFPAGTWILPTLKFLSKSMRLRSLGGMRLKGASTSIIKLESVYRGIRKKKFTDYR